MTDKHLPTEYQEFIALSRYARWLPEQGRREAWPETVGRYVDFWVERGLDKKTAGEIRDAILNLEVMPSMRCLMTAGEALKRDNVAGFNCSYSAIEGGGESIDVLTTEMRDAGFTEPVKIQLSSPVDFDEIMYVLLCGTGVGFSVERQFINNLPVVGHKLPRGIYARNGENYPGVDPAELSHMDRRNNKVVVADTKYGWASALRIFIVELYNGNFTVGYDTSRVRPKGAPLKTFGGRASGPEPLIDLFNFLTKLFHMAHGRKLTSIECHDVVCKIADVIVVGGVRRSALISLSNLTDRRMAVAKSGAWWENDGQRALANNSIAFTEKPDVGSWMQEWLTIYQSHSGERGIFSRPASKAQAAANDRRDPNHDFGTNPCSEIILRSKQFCNLSEVVVRPTDGYDDLVRKVRIATIMGTLQATLTDFVYLRPIWRQNTIEEALLGVSLTGMMDHPVLSKTSQATASWLQDLRSEAIFTNAKWAKKLGINQSAAITCVKPSGTVSQLVDSASGLHPRYARYYIRTVRADAKDPLARFMADQGFPWEWAIGKEGSVMVFSFPMQAPKDAVYRDDRTAIEQLEHWLMVQDNWCEHKPSITVYVRDHEWPEVGSWVWYHFDKISGVSFLPYDNGTYQQAPYQEITEEQYREALAAMPKGVDWAGVGAYEEEDRTQWGQTLACVGGACEVVDL